MTTVEILLGVIKGLLAIIDEQSIMIQELLKQVIYLIGTKDEPG